MNITLIAAMGSNGVIGMDDKIPWMGQLPKDMQHFRALTLGKTVVMGRKTYESMGRPLKDRTNIVLTRNANWVAPEGVTVATSIDEIIQIARDGKELKVIGGAEIYALFLPLARTIELTVIEHEFEGNVYFPLFDKAHISPLESKVWDVVFRVYAFDDEKNKYPMTFMTLVRR